MTAWAMTYHLRATFFYSLGIKLLSHLGWFSLFPRPRAASQQQVSPPGHFQKSSTLQSTQFSAHSLPLAAPLATEHGPHGSLLRQSPRPQPCCSCFKLIFWKQNNFLKVLTISNSLILFEILCLLPPHLTANSLTITCKVQTLTNFSPFCN